jgi:tRNA threonylcarbamoyladenosine biosynthesis protein TsaB
VRILGIETATAAQSVALLEDEQLLAEAAWSGAGSRGGKLLPMIDSVLREAGVAPSAIEAIAVSVGPGSFTGVRVGLATAKGMVLGTHAVLIGVSTLEALAVGYARRKTIVCVLLDAGRGEVYAGLYQYTDAGLEQLSPEAVLSPEAIAVQVLALTAGEIRLIGDGAARYRERLEAALQGRARVTDEGCRAVPRAALVARLAFRQLQKAGGTALESEVMPVYLRRAEAEMNWEKGLVKSPLERLSKAIR